MKVTGTAVVLIALLGLAVSGGTAPELLGPAVAAGSNNSDGIRLLTSLFADTTAPGAPITEAMIGYDINGSPPNPDDPPVTGQGASGDGYARGSPDKANVTFFIKLGASETADGFVYAQRHGADWGTVSSMDFW